MLTQEADTTSGTRNQSVVDKPQAARIICSWTANPADMRKYSVGVTSFESCSGSFCERARIKIFTAYLNGTTSSCDLKSIAVHEIGHALGIDGHSGIPSDIMYYSKEFNNSENSTELSSVISERDVSTIRQVYGFTKVKPTLALSKGQTQHVTVDTNSTKVRRKANQARTAR